MRARPVSYLFRIHTFLLLLAMPFVLGTATICGATTTTPTLKYAPALTHVPLLQGGTATDLFILTTGGSFQGNVALTVSGLPAGVTGTWSQNPVTLSSGTGASTLTLAAASTAVANWFTFKVTASGSGLTLSTIYTVMVEVPPGVQLKIWIPSLSMQSMGNASFSVEANPAGGVTVPAGAAGATAQIVSGLPAGITSSWSSPSLTASGAVMWLVTLTGSANAAASHGTLNLAVSVRNGGTGTPYSATLALPLTVALTPAKLAFTAANTHLPVKEGASATNLFSLTGGGSFHGNVTLAVTGLPPGVTGSFSPSQVALASGSGSSALTLTASPTAVVNWFHYTVTASGDGLSSTNTYIVEVEPTIGIQVQLSSTAVTLSPQSKSTLSITATPIHGVIIPIGATGASATITSTLPSGVTASLSQPVLTAGGAASWTLSLSTSSNAAPGTEPVTLAVQVTDATSGAPYSVSQSFNLLVSLVASVNIGDTPGIKIPANFMGLAHEWGMAQAVMGSNAVGVNQTYRQLLKNLTAYGSGPVNLRIGGNSTDSTGEPTPTTVAPLAQLAQALGTKFELGVNLGANDVSLATSQAKAYISQMPAGSIEAIEIGNEPDWYARNGLRNTTYTVQDYYSDFYTWKQSINPLLPSGTRFIGPSWAVLSMLPNLPAFESQYANDLTFSSQHFYVTSPASTLPADYLLGPKASTSGPAQVAASVASTHAQGLAFRLDELNSISVGGQPGISDAFGAALWSVDTMFEYINVGVDGVNWQTPGGCYSPFTFTVNRTNGTATYRLSTINPLYYGLLLFQAATGDQSQMLPTSLTTSANLKAWASTDTSGNVKLVLINKDEALSGTVEVNLPGYSQASIVRLKAPSFTATTGVTIGGQTFDGSTDGTLQGAKTVETIDGEGGIFYLPITTTSAALATFVR